MKRAAVRRVIERTIALIGPYPETAGERATHGQAYRRAAWFGLKCGLMFTGLIHWAQGIWGWLS